MTVAGIAKPVSPPLRMPRVLMPMTSPSVLTSGPPELPGLMAASVWSHRLYSLTPGRNRRVQDTMPMLTLRDMPHGAPIAITKSPSLSRAESPSFAKGGGDSPGLSLSWSSERSTSLSVPTIFAS
jgi:hypothetical protein